ncbi:MAG TPA: ABC transporter permease subunit [Anaerolineae bacterium]|jgi:ABC-2 type transport system permease protein|nr:ABC transporter permease subunit [Anaerolineae bacterium]
MTTTAIPGVRSRQRLALTNSFTKAIADRLLLTLIVGIGVGAMGLAMGPIYLALEDVLEEMLAQFPESIMAIAGGADMTTAAGYYTGEMYSIVVPFAVMFVAATSVARAFGGEMENGTIGLVMSTPTRRTRLATEKAVAMIIHVVLAAALVGVMVWIGIVASGLDIAVGNVFAISLMLSLVSVFVGGISMVVSILSGRGVLAILAGMLVAIAMYAWSSFVPMAEAIADLAWLSPWHHYIGTDPLGSGVDWASAALLTLLAVVPLAVGVYLFKRRDIAA